MKQLIALVLALGSPCLSSADPVTDWNATATTASFAAGLDNEFGCVDPLHESRMLAMMHVAIHDALNAIDRRYQPYAYDGARAPGASPEAAVAAAARDVLVALFPQLPPDIGPTPGPAVALVEAAYANALASIPNSPAKTQGIRIGQAAAAAILALRSGDGSDAPFLDFNYVAGTNPGDFQLIPGLPFAAAPLWGAVTPFVLRASSQYRPKAPYDVRSKKYAADFNEVKSLGRIDSTTRTEEQKQIALFWVEGSPQGWNRIARTVSAQQGVDLWENARLFGLLNLASADAYIADFENKYFYEFWRPITAIRAARYRRQSGYCRRPDLGFARHDTTGARLPLRAQRAGRRHVGSAGAVLWRRRQLQHDEHDAAGRHSFIHAASRRPRKRTPTRESTSGSISATPLSRDSSLAARSGRWHSTTICAQCIDGEAFRMLAPAGVTVTPAGPTHDVATRWQRLRCGSRHCRSLALCVFRLEPGMSPGWHESASQMASSAEKRIARASPAVALTSSSGLQSKAF